MAEILKQWLTERLQRPISWETEEFGEMMKNGHIIASILLSYNVINDEKLFLIRASNNKENIKNNWKYLHQWLADVDVHLTDGDLANIMEGKGSALLRLFYQLFLHLDKRDRTDFIKRERIMVSRLVEKLGHRFQVEKVVEEDEPFVDDLSRPLLNERHFIEWQRNKAKQVKDTYDYIRHKYSKTLAKIEESQIPLKYEPPTAPKKTSKERAEMEKFATRFPSGYRNYTYEQLLELEQKAAERRKSIVDTEWAKNYMENLYTKLEKKTDSEQFQKQITNVMSGSLWDLSIAEEEYKLDSFLARKVMKLSQFEKQMCTQIIETKQQARNLARNRMKGEMEFTEQRTQQFNQFLDNVKEQIHSEVVEIDFEKHRQNMLHKKLYAEKMKRKRQQYYEICYDTMLSIVDYATKYAYFRRLIEDEIPDHFIHEWKNLFFKQQPIFDIFDPMEDILKEQGMEEQVASEEEEIIRLELDRQEALGDVDFYEYRNYTHPWTLESLIPNYDPESEDRKYEYLGSRILGHLVYTLLEIKYPYPAQLPPAELPEMKSKVLLRGLPDRSLTVAMQTLLNHRKIHVVKLESAINFCLKSFKTEMIGCTDIDLSFDKYTSVAQDEEQREIIKLLKTDDDLASRSSDASTLLAGPSPPNTKQTQTPKALPEEDITLSAAATLGKYAYESLNFGDSLTDHLLAACIVEYIKDQDKIEGFVIVNYPNSYREAQILEETFSGRKPPQQEELDDSDDIYLEQSIIKHRKKEKDLFKDVRVSKLVNNPHKRKEEKPFESYFTAYIHLKETVDILQEPIIWDLTAENSEFIDRFYAALGINYSMYFEVMDKEFLTQMCKYIIGDLLPMKSYDSLFGESVLSKLEFNTSEDRKLKTKVVKPETSNGKSKDKLHRGSKSSKESASSDLDAVKRPSQAEVTDETIALLEPVTEEEVVFHADLSLEEVVVLAGEEDWVYGAIPIAEVIGTALAGCWEETEKCYIRDMKQLFFAKRLQMNSLVPYTRFIKDKMEQIITMPSTKQDLVSKFQKRYNDFENDWRDYKVTKNEWHCRINELQKQLYRISDERKLFAQQQRHLLICNNWAMEELTSMVNTYISCMQAELNRSMLTYQALHDFYFAMIKRMPPNERLTSKDLTKICKESDESSGSKKGGEEKVFRQLKQAFQDLQSNNINIDYSNNPFNMIIENNVKMALKYIKDTNDHYRSLISKEYNEYAKIVPTTKKKDENTSEESINAEESFKQNALKCIDEWTMGINGVMYRACLRLLALQYKCYRDMKLFNDQISKAFTDIQTSINTYYMNEIKSIDRLCKFFQMAVENAKRIPETLLLEHDTFIIDPNLLQFPGPEQKQEPLDVTEVVNDFEFKISQLARLRSQFKIVAPTGIMLQQAFIYIIQDFIFFGKECCEAGLFPETFARIDPEQVLKLVFLIFGDTAYIDWRDFLIYCLNIRFPTIDELLYLRKQLRCCDINSTELIHREHFINLDFWFDQQFDLEDKYAQLRIVLIKHFLFELYESKPDYMNYSAFLLAFCKSTDPIEGFANAVSMAVGKKCCYVFKQCEEVICKLIKDKMYKDECMACALLCTNELIDKVLKRVIMVCESIAVEELEYIEPSPDPDGKKKKKGKGKGKRPESSSARQVKPQKALISKTKIPRSESDLKTSKTYICPPCAEDEETEEKPPEKEVVEEEQKPVIKPDPDIAYSVSQTTLWNILKICLPWHFSLIPEERPTEYVEKMQEVIKRLAVDTETGDIYVSKFVLDPFVCRLLHKVNKFTALNLTAAARKVFL